MDYGNVLCFKLNSRKRSHSRWEPENFAKHISYLIFIMKNRRVRFFFFPLCKLQEFSIRLNLLKVFTLRMFLCPNHHFSASFSVSKLKFQSRKHNNASLASVSQWCPVAFYLLLLINNKNMFLIWFQLCVVLFFPSAGCIAPETSKQ
jgi:hypothetical protein